MRCTVVALLALVVFLVGCGLSDAYRPPSCPRPRPCITLNRCKIRTWRRVTQSMVSSSYKVGVKIVLANSGGGLQINGNVYHNGCGRGAGSGAVIYIRGAWTQIRYTQEFRGSASCWKIFGGAANPKYRKDFAFYKNLRYKPSNSVHDFSASAGDGIFNEFHMNRRSRNAFDGRVYRCDNEATNFWHGKNGGGLRRATVMLRRSNLKEKAGIMTETSCGTPSYVIKDIWILM